MKFLAISLIVHTPHPVTGEATSTAERFRELIINVTSRQNFIGSPRTIAETINDYVQADASDGFILVPHITPDGLGEFADKVVPLLQEKGVFRTEYEGTTLRDNLGLRPLEPGLSSQEAAA